MEPVISTWSPGSSTLAGNLRDGGNLTIESGAALSWTGGTMGDSGSTIVASGGTMSITNAVGIRDTRTVVNHRTFSWNAVATASASGGCVLNASDSEDHAHPTHRRSRRPCRREQRNRRVHEQRHHHLEQRRPR